MFFRCLIIINETFKILWDFARLTDYLILAREPELFIINKKKKKKEKERDRENLPYSGLFRPRWPQRENQRRQKETCPWNLPVI